MQRNPKWSSDELILALELYFQFEDFLPDSSNEKVIKLSEELIHFSQNGNDTITSRNPNSVSMKLANFSRLDPKYIDRGRKGLSRGGKLDTDVWNEFSQNIALLKKVAQAIRYSMLIFKDLDHNDFDESFVEAQEGRLLTRAHTYRERNPKLSQQKKDRALAIHGKLVCEGCEFSFEDQYGLRGKGYIECHHTLPLSEYSVVKITKLEHLALICANCHRMIHSKKKWLTMEELRLLVSQSKKF